MLSNQPYILRIHFKMHFSQRTGLICLWLLVGLSACCTKKLCTDERPPEIIVVYKGFIPGTPTPVQVYALDRNTGTRVDSVDLTSYFNGTVRLYEGRFSRLEAGTFNEHTYVLAVGSAKDTIRDVSYQEYTYDVACNKCVLTDGSVVVRGYKDFEFRHRGRLYQDADSLVIER